MKTTLRLSHRPAMIALTFAILLSGMTSMRAGAPPAVTVGAGAEALAQTDNDFCRLAVAEGAVKAFEVYLAADAANPLPDSVVPRDKKTTIESMREVDTAGMVLTWHPLRAEIAASGELGYTYGPWEMRKKDGGTLVAKGFYVTIWKKSDGKWKAAFDMGNEAAVDAK